MMSPYIVRMGGDCTIWEEIVTMEILKVGLVLTMPTYDVIHFCIKGMVEGEGRVRVHAHLTHTHCVLSSPLLPPPSSLPPPPSSPLLPLLPLLPPFPLEAGLAEGNRLLQVEILKPKSASLGISLSESRSPCAMILISHIQDAGIADR